MREYFQQLGFNDTEREIYVTLAEFGRGTANFISKQSGISRTTVYSALANLINKKVVSEDSESGTTIYIANPPSSLRSIVESQISISLRLSGEP